MFPPVLRNAKRGAWKSWDRQVPDLLPGRRIGVLASVPPPAEVKCNVENLEHGVAVVTGSRQMPCRYVAGSIYRTGFQPSWQYGNGGSDGTAFPGALPQAGMERALGARL